MRIGIGMDITQGGILLFSPLSRGNVSVWLDASDSPTVIESAGAVSQWTDKSGSGNHALQATAFNRPVTNTRTQNGLNVIDFDGTAGYMKTAAFSADQSQPNTIFLVGARDVTTADNYFYDGLTGSKRNAILVDASAHYQMFAGAGLVSTATVDTSVHLHTNVFNTTSSEYFVDSVSVVAGAEGTQALDGLSLGTAGGVFGLLNGFIAEVIVYDALLTAPEIAFVDAYLTAKWGV